LSNWHPGSPEHRAAAQEFYYLLLSQKVEEVLAELYAATVEVTKAKGEYIVPSLGRVTVGELAPEWLARKQHVTAPSHHRMLEST